MGLERGAPGKFTIEPILGEGGVEYPLVPPAGDARVADSARGEGEVLSFEENG